MTVKNYNGTDNWIWDRYVECHMLTMSSSPLEAFSSRTLRDGTTPLKQTYGTLDQHEFM